MSKPRMGKTFSALLLLILFPLGASALSVAEIQSQIQSVQERIAALYAELQHMGAATTSGGDYSAPSPNMPTFVIRVKANLPCLSLGRTLGVGSRGEDVRQLQVYLIAAQLLSSDSATGYFGPLTESAVKKFQISKGLPSGGVGFGTVGPTTQTLILAGCARKGQNTGASISPSCSPVSIPSTLCSGNWEKRYGSDGCMARYECVKKILTIDFAAGSPGKATAVGTTASSSSKILTTPGGESSDTPSPSSISFGVSSSTAGTCMHEGVSYAHGSTISVPCEAGACTAGSSSGYITATCSIGKWCIPFTEYCATSIKDINVNAYSGQNATQISTSGTTLNCPQIGWRARLDCAVLPACKTGWNICTAGGWVYDSDQSVH